MRVIYKGDLLYLKQLDSHDIMKQVDKISIIPD